MSCTCPYHVIHHVNSIKEEKQLIISTDKEKACDEVQNPFSCPILLINNI